MNLIRDPPVWHLIRDTVMIYQSSALPTLQATGQMIAKGLMGGEILGWEQLKSFSYTADQLEYHHLRWPGGIPAEDGIDTNRDGNREVVYDITFADVMDWRRADGTEREGLTEVLAEAVARKMSFAMIMPTAKYVGLYLEQDDGDFAPIEAQIRAEVGQFVSRLAGGQFGEVPPEFILEIGSEYYATDLWRQYTAAEHGTTPTPNLAAVFADVFAVIVDQIHSTVSEMTVAGENVQGIDPVIAVQMGRFQSNTSSRGSFADNDLFVDALQKVDALRAVDALIWHRYGTSFDQINDGLSTEIYGHTLDEVMSYWNRATGRSLDLVVGWNSPDVNNTPRLENGAAGLTNILQMYSELAAAGTDYATLFALGISNGGSHSFGQELFVGAQLYDMLIESTLGTYVNPIFQNNKSTVIDGSYRVDNAINQYIFESADRTVIYLAASDLPSIQSASDTYELEYCFDREASRVVVRSLAIAEEGNLHETVQLLSNGTWVRDRVTGVISDITAGTTVTHGDSTSLNITFQRDFEVIEIVLFHDSEGPTSIGGHPSDGLVGTSGRDELYGRRGADQLEGRAGADRLFGQTGNDTLFGGDGPDSLYGGSGRDFMYGGNQADSLRGGSGKDHLFGGDHSDSLQGDGGDDRLWGGADDDLLFGGSGDDFLSGEMGNDRIYGGIGNDIIHSGGGTNVLRGGLGADQFHFWARDGWAGIEDFTSGSDHIFIHGTGASLTWSRSTVDGQNRLVVSYDTDEGGGTIALLEHSGHIIIYSTNDFVFLP